MLLQALCVILVTIGEFNVELQSGNAQFGSKSPILLAVWQMTFCMDIASVIDNHYWTDGWTDRHKDRRTEPFIDLLGRS